MSIEDRTEFIAKHLFQQINQQSEPSPSLLGGVICGNQAKLNYKTSKYPKNMLRSNLQNCKYFVKLSAISISTIGIILTGQPEKAEARTNANILDNFLAKSSQTILNWNRNSIKKSKFVAPKQNHLSTPNINHNLSLAKQPNWSSATRELSNSKSQTSSETKAKEYVFQIPSFETTQPQLSEYTELNSESSVTKKNVKQIYTVKQGDTLNQIASLHGISRQELIKKNNIRNPHLIFVSQQIKIPQTKAKESFGTTQRSKSFISNRNSINILAQNSNQRDNPSGQNLVPQLSGLDNSEIENYEDTVAIPIEMTVTLGATITPELPPLSSPEQYLPASPAAEFNGYIWPARGTLTSGYGWRWGRAHRGIDIAAPIGTPIVAAASGEVISAGWNSGGYGNLVKVKHPNGSVTFYAHNHKIMVRRGQKVKQGQQIAQMGSTGYSTGSHLHFEIRSNGRTAVNPIAYLPKK